MILYDYLSNAPLVDGPPHHQLIRRDHLAAIFCMTAQSVMPRPGKPPSAFLLGKGRRSDVEPPERTSRIIKLNHSTDSIPSTREWTESSASAEGRVGFASSAAFWASRCWKRGAGSGASTVGEPGGADSKKRYLRMRASSRRIEICPTTKPCRKVGCRDNSDVAGILLSDVFESLATTVEVTGKWPEASRRSKSEPHPKHMGTRRCLLRRTSIDSRVILMPWYNDHSCNKIVVEAKKKPQSAIR